MQRADRGQKLAPSTQWRWAVFTIATASVGFYLGARTISNAPHDVEHAKLQRQVEYADSIAKEANRRLAASQFQLTLEQSKLKSLQRTYEKSEQGRLALVNANRKQKQMENCMSRHAALESRLALTTFRTSVTPKSMKGILKKLGARFVGIIPGVGDAAAAAANYLETREVSAALRQAEMRVQRAQTTARKACSSISKLRT